MRRLARRLLLAGALAGGVLLPLGAVLRLTARDRFDGLAILFYLTPWPVIAVGSAILALLWSRRKQRRSAAAFALLALAAFCAWPASSWLRHDGPTRRGDLRVVHWNVDRPVGRLAGDALWLRAQDADIIALAEAHHRRKASRLALWQAEFPGYQAVEAQGEMICLIRGRVIAHESRQFAANSYFVLMQTEIRGRPVTVLQVDITPRPTQSRRRSFENLMLRARPHIGENLILVGDFNTPRESFHLETFRADFANAFETAGNGFAETWPWPLAVLSLDQVWSSRRLRAIRCEHGHSLRSDHRAVIADFDFVTD